MTRNPFWRLWPLWGLLLWLAGALGGCQSAPRPPEMARATPTVSPAPPSSAARPDAKSALAFSPRQGPGYAPSADHPGFWRVPEIPHLVLENAAGYLRTGPTTAIVLGFHFHFVDGAPDVSRWPCHDAGVGEPGAPVCYRLIQSLDLFWPDGGPIATRVLGGGASLLPQPTEILALEVLSSSDQARLTPCSDLEVLARLDIAVSESETQTVKLWVPLTKCMFQGG